MVPNTRIRLAVLLLAALPFAARAGDEPPVDRSLQMRIDAVKADPDDPRNHFNLGLEYYNRAQQEQPGAPQVALFSRAMGALQQATKVAKKNTEAHAQVDLSAFQLLGNISIELKQYGDAVDWFEKGLKRAPADAACLYGRAQAYYIDKKIGAAKEAFEAYLKGTAGATDADAKRYAPQALTYLGAMAMDLHKYDEAAGYFRRVIAEFPKQSKGASQNLSLVLVAQGDELRKKKMVDDAAKTYDAAVAADPQNGDALKSSAAQHQDIARGLKGAKEQEKKAQQVEHLKLAEKNFLRVVAIPENANDFRIWYSIGFIQYELEKFDDAIAAFKKSVEIDPNQPDARYNLALSLMRRNAWEEAMAQAEEAKKLNKEDKSVAALVTKIFDDWRDDLLKKAQEAFTGDRVLEAIAAWEKVVQLDPKNPDAPKLIEQAKVRLTELIDDYTKRGDIAYKEGDLLTASSEWNAALLLQPDSADLKKRLSKVSGAKRGEGLRKQAQAAFTAKDYPLAMSKVTEALAVNPKDAASIALRKKIVTAQASGTKTVLARVNDLLKKGRLKEAKRDIDAAKEASPNDKPVLDLFQKVNKRIQDAIAQYKAEGAAALTAGNKDTAKARYDAALSLDATDKEAQEGYKKAAGGQASKAVASADKIKMLNKKGIFAYMQNNLAEAKKVWQEAHELDPDNAEINRSLDRVNQKLKATKGA